MIQITTVDHHLEPDDFNKASDFIKYQYGKTIVINLLLLQIKDAAAKSSPNITAK